MNQKEFDVFLDTVIKDIKDTMISKGEEYSTSKNKLHNFDKAAIIGQTTPLKASIGMQLKHLVSLSDLYEKFDRGEAIDHGLLREKTKDAINYYILQEAIIRRG